MVVVSNVPIVPSCVAPLTTTKGTSTGAITVATFTDAGGPEVLSRYTATIDWGDGTTSAGTIGAGVNGVFSVTGTNTYATQGHFPVLVTLAHDSLPPVAITDAITVVAPALVGTGWMSLSATKAADSGSVTVATFTDPTGPDDLSTYSATIDWGDGSTSDGEISRDGSTFTVTGSHVYLTTGTKAITVTLKHQGSPGVTVSSTATVSNPAVSPTFSPFEAVAGVAATNQLVATFLDPSGPDAASSYSATIDWGDGTISAGTIEAVDGVIMVTGTHTYAAVGTFTVTVTVVHGPSPSATV